ncbi:MAG: MFS transporter [Candidatus Omnitrophica bacterium]|nr:MFS transporter [Candidatus Omnitrophota bacterium]MBU1869269.1 MFS transporter [Candidatus Omnitrophota bacterium]
MPKIREVLKNRDFFLLWVGQIISQLGDRLGFMALIGFAYSKKDQGSPAEIFKILLFTIIPVFLIGPIAGAYVDRWDRRRTMYLCDLLRMLLVLIIPFFLFYQRNLPIAYCIIFLIFCLARFFVPAKLAIVPDLVEKKHLLMANSLVNVTGMIAFVIGSGVGGVLVEWVGAEKGFYLDALSFLVSALLIFSISTRWAVKMNFKRISGEIVEVIKKSVAQEIKEGFIYFVSKKDIRFTSWILFVVASALGILSVVSIVFIQNTLHSATKDLGLLIMFLGAGLFVGTLAYGKFCQRVSHYKAIFVAFILSGGLIICFTLSLSRYPHFGIAMALALMFGLLVSPIMSVVNTIIHKTSDNDMRGKIFSSLEIVMHFGFLLFMWISSILAERFSNSLILVIVGCVFIALGIINLIFHRRIPWLD